LLDKINLDNGDTSWLSCTQKARDRDHEDCCTNNYEGRPHFRGIDWVIVGGESGPQSRPFDLAWARSIVAQCRYAGVPCFVKQFGAAPFDSQQNELLGAPRLNGPCILALNSRKGGDPSEWPADLRVREFPRVARGTVRHPVGLSGSHGGD
jgi:hypothetical protein